MVERATGETLEKKISENVRDPRHVKSITFWPAKKAPMHDRVADLSKLERDWKQCLSTGGSWSTDPQTVLVAEECSHRHGTPLAAMTALMPEIRSCSMRNHMRKLFRPQLSEPSRQALQTPLESDDGLYQELGGKVYYGPGTDAGVLGCSVVV